MAIALASPPVRANRTISDHGCNSTNNSANYNVEGDSSDEKILRLGAKPTDITLES